MSPSFLAVLSAASPPSRGAWIEMGLQLNHSFEPSTSPPSRGVWIEIPKMSVFVSWE